MSNKEDVRFQVTESHIRATRGHNWFELDPNEAYWAITAAHWLNEASYFFVHVTSASNLAPFLAHGVAAGAVHVEEQITKVDGMVEVYQTYKGISGTGKSMIFGLIGHRYADPVTGLPSKLTMYRWYNGRLESPRDPDAFAWSRNKDDDMGIIYNLFDLAGPMAQLWASDGGVALSSGVADGTLPPHLTG